VYRADIPPDMRNELHIDHVEVMLTTVPGALVLAAGRSALAHLTSGGGHVPAAFVAQLPTAEARAAFSGAAPLAVWGLVGDPGAGVDGKNYAKLEEALKDSFPDAPGLIKEYLAVFQLLFDSTAMVDVRSDGFHWLYQLTFM
jgi:hypothetical protein